MFKLKKWKAQLRVGGKLTNLGYFDDEKEAARAYDKTAAAKGRPLNFNGSASEDEVEEEETTQEQVGAAAETDAPETVAVSKAEPLAGEDKDTKTSRFTGVAWNRKNKTWQARINIDGKTSHLGCFDDEEDAARKYDKAAASIPGRMLNFPRAAPMQPCINGDVGDAEGEKVRTSVLHTAHDEVLTQLDSLQDALEATQEDLEETQALPADLEETQALPEPTTKAPIETSDSSSDESEEEKSAQLEASDEDEEEDDDENDMDAEEEEEDDDFSKAARIETALRAAVDAESDQGVTVALAKAAAFEMSFLVLRATGLALIVGRLRRHSDPILSKVAVELVSKWKTLRA